MLDDGGQTESTESNFKRFLRYSKSLLGQELTKRQNPTAETKQQSQRCIVCLQVTLGQVFDFAFLFLFKLW